MGDILAFDLGTRTGVARGEPGALPADLRLTTWEMPSRGGENVGPFAGRFMQLLKAEFEAGPLDLVIFEAPYVNRGKARPDVIRRLFGMPFAIEGFAHARGIECAEVNIATLKKEFAGHGRAEKEDMILAAHRRGLKVGDEHQADASAAWLHAISVRHPELLHIYDPDFRSFMRAPQ